MKTVYKNKWLSVVEKPYKDENYYALSVPDYVSIVVEQDNKFLFIEEYRPIIGQYTLGFPSGMIEPNEIPIDCAIRELAEETGYNAFPESVQLMGFLYPDVGRMTNKMWCFYTNKFNGTPKMENGIYKMEFMDTNIISGNIAAGNLLHSLTLSCLYMACRHTGKIKI